MAYFMIGENDYSAYTNELKVANNANYIAQMNAAGNTVVDLISQKRTISVGIIPLNDSVMAQLKNDIDNFSVSISFRNPNTNELTTGMACIIPDNEVEYYTIQAGKVSYKAVNLTFIEL